MNDVPYVFAATSFRFPIFFYCYIFDEPLQDVCVCVEWFVVRWMSDFGIRCDTRGQASALYVNVIRLKYYTLRSSCTLHSHATFPWYFTANMHKLNVGCRYIHLELIRKNEEEEKKSRRCRKMAAEKGKMKMPTTSTDTLIKLWYELLATLWQTFVNVFNYAMLFI